MKQYSVALIVSMILAFMGYMLAVLWGGSEQTLQALKSLSLPLWLLILGLSLGNYSLRFFRWETYLRQISDVVIPKSHHLLIYSAGFALTTTPAKAGEALRSFYLKPMGVDFRTSLSLLFVERLNDLLAVILIAIFTASYLGA